MFSVFLISKVLVELGIAQIQCYNVNIQCARGFLFSEKTQLREQYKICGALSKYHFLSNGSG